MMDDDEIRAALNADVVCGTCYGCGEDGEGGRYWTCRSCNGKGVKTREAVDLVRAIGFLLLNRSEKP